MSSRPKTILEKARRIVEIIPEINVGAYNKTEETLTALKSQPADKRDENAIAAATKKCDDTIKRHVDVLREVGTLSSEIIAMTLQIRRALSVGGKLEE